MLRATIDVTHVMTLVLLLSIINLFVYSPQGILHVQLVIIQGKMV